MRQEELVKMCNKLREVVVEHEKDEWEAEELLNAINQLESGELYRLKKRRKKEKYQYVSDYLADHDYEVRCASCGKLVSVDDICDWEGNWRGRGIPVDYIGSLRCINCVEQGFYHFEEGVNHERE